MDTTIIRLRYAEQTQKLKAKALEGDENDSGEDEMVVTLGSVDDDVESVGQSDDDSDSDESSSSSDSASDDDSSSSSDSETDEQDLKKQEDLALSLIKGTN